MVENVKKESAMTEQEIRWPEKWADLRVAALDVETTGFNPDTDRIIEIGIVIFERGEVVERWGQLVDPQMEIPAEVVQLTGIKQEDVDGQPRFEKVAEEVHRRLQGVGIGAYNLSFDRGFIQASLERCGLSWPASAPTFDPLIFARELQSEHRRHKLGAVAERLGLTLENAHRAVDDAEVAGQILYAFSQQLPDSLQDILILQAQWERQQAANQHWRSSDRGPSLDLQSMTQISGQTVGLGPAYIYGEELDPLRAIYMSVPEVQRS
jgi:DNA polymerase III epsilon subunit family exonuclease